MRDTLPPVLHLVDSLAIGGAERMAVNLTNVLASDGHKVHLCATRAAGPLQSFISPRVSFLMLDRRGVLDFCAIQRLVSYIRRNGIKLVHAHSSSFFLASVIKPLTGVKILWHDHLGNREYHSKQINWILRACSPLFSWVFTASETLRFWGVVNLAVCPDKITYLKNFPALGTTTGRSIVLPGRKEFRIVCAARLNLQKDHLTLVRGMQRVNAKLPQANLLLVGYVPDDTYVSTVKALIVELGLSECVHLLGCQTDMVEILSQSAVGVLSSQSEGLPVALLEYGLCSLPVVCTSVGECSSVLGHGEFGRLIPPGQPEALSAALIELLQDPAKQRVLGDAFHTHVTVNYSASAICKQVADIYGKVLGD